MLVINVDDRHFLLYNAALLLFKYISLSQNKKPVVIATGFFQKDLNNLLTTSRGFNFFCNVYTIAIV